MTGVVQNQDSVHEGENRPGHYYDKVQAALQEAMDEYYLDWPALSDG